MISRRSFFRLLTGLFAASAATSAYGVVIEPLYRLRVTRYALTPPGWPKGLRLRIALVADVHACEPWMPAARVRRIADFTNSLAPDCTLLLGDYVCTTKFRSGLVAAPAWAAALGALKAPLGVHAILGNHDWWDDDEAQRRGAGPVAAGRALENAGIRVYDNDVLRLEKDGQPFWLAGLGDQWAFGVNRRRAGRFGADDLPGTLAKITDDAPVILMAHEPDIFVRVPQRVSVTVSGHTHGGQVRLFGKAFVVPSRYGDRFVYGHIVEEQRHLIVSGGLGCSGLPVRIGSPPEIVLLELGEPPIA